MKQHGQPQKRYAKWKKPGTKGDTLYNSICMTLYRRLNYRNRNKISSFQGMGGRGRVLATEKQEGTNSWGDENSLYTDFGASSYITANLLPHIKL